MKKFILGTAFVLAAIVAPFVISAQTATSTLGVPVVSPKYLAISTSYNSLNKQVYLNASMDLNITAKNGPIYIPAKDAAGANFVNTTNSQFSVMPNDLRATTTIVTTIKPVSDRLGNLFYRLEPGQTLVAKVRISGNTDQMFAGNYYGQVCRMYYSLGLNNWADGYYKWLDVTNVKTSLKYIVGEKSPWIQSITQSGQTVTIKGERLSGSTVVIKGSTYLSRDFKFSTDGKTVTFASRETVPTLYAISLYNAVGWSNSVSFRIFPINKYDINQDGLVDQKDVDLVSACILNSTNCLAAYRTMADVNASGKIDAVDLQLVINAANASLVGNVETRLSSSSSAYSRIIKITTSGETKGVTLGAVDLKISGKSGTINELKLAVKDIEGRQPLSNIIKRLYLYDGTSSVPYVLYPVSSLNSFSNMNVGLAQDQWKTLTIKADIADADDLLAGSAPAIIVGLDANSSNIVGIDSNYNKLTVSSNNVESATTTFTSGPNLAINDASGVIGTNSLTATATVKFTFTLTNNWASNLYVGKNPSVFVGTSTNAVKARLTALSSGVSSLDGVSSYGIPMGGRRQFVLSGLVSNVGGTAGMVWFKIDKIYFGDSRSALQKYNLASNLENLNVSAYLGNKVGLRGDANLRQLALTLDSIRALLKEVVE